MGEKVLVTGAAGFIGFHLTKRLIERGDQVVGIDNVNDYYDAALSAYICFDQGRRTYYPVLPNLCFLCRIPFTHRFCFKPSSSLKAQNCCHSHPLPALQKHRYQVDAAGIFPLMQVNYAFTGHYSYDRTGKDVRGPVLVSINPLDADHGGQSIGYYINHRIFIFLGKDRGDGKGANSMP